MFVRIAIYCKIDEIGADTAIIQQSVALSRCAIGADRFAHLLEADEERQEVSLGLARGFGECRIGLDLVEPGVQLPCQKAIHAGFTRKIAVFVREKDPQRTAMCGDLFDIENLEPMTAGHFFYGQQ
ncbi:hypothetical protein D3C87_1423160 [compost metagenome]